MSAKQLIDVCFKGLPVYARKDERKTKRVEANDLKLILNIRRSTN